MSEYYLSQLTNYCQCTQPKAWPMISRFGRRTSSGWAWSTFRSRRDQCEFPAVAFERDCIRASQAVSQTVSQTVSQAGAGAQGCGWICTICREVGIFGSRLVAATARSLHRSAEI